LRSDKSFHGKRGVELLSDPALNKSTGFTAEEREQLGLVGLVPDVTESEELQVRRVMQQLGYKNTDLERFIYLSNLIKGAERHEGHSRPTQAGTAFPATVKHPRTRALDGGTGGESSF